MCDQTEVSYLPGDVVWVKLGPVWWPGKVCNNDEIPPEVFKELRKTPIAVVKFFQEGTFEYVKKLTHIYHYNCLKKNEFIKKGLDLCRASNRDAPSNMKLFPEDIATAEVLTGGDPNIIHDEMFLPEKKPSYAADFAPTPKKTPKKIKIERKKESTPSKSTTPRVITHPRFIRHGVCDYEARERKQIPLRAECDEEDNSPPTTYRCPDCDFTTIRLNVIVLHNKSHVRNYASQHTAVKGVKRKSSSAVRFKEKRPVIDRESSDYVKPKIPKTPKTPIEKSKSKIPQKKSPSKRAIEKESSQGDKPLENDRPVVKKKRPQGNTDEYQNSLLEDWAEFENEPEPNDDSVVSDDLNESTASSSQVSKSCFDFDDSEDGLVIDKSKIRAGRKIPRVLENSKCDKNEDSNASDETSNTIEEQTVSCDSNKNGIDAVNEHEYAETRKTSQLQEMGVDNEIEIDSEDVNEPKDDVEPEPTPNNVPETESNPEEVKKTLEKEHETEELKQKVDKLLEEISAPSKLPDIPYSMKKAHIKSFNESEQQAKREAEQKQASEALKTESVEIAQPNDQSKPGPAEIPENNTDSNSTPSTEPEPPASVEITETNSKPIKIVLSAPKTTLMTGVTGQKFKITSLNKVVSPVKQLTSPTKVIAATSPTDGKSQSTIINKLQTVDGKTLVSLPSPQKFIINKNKSIIFDPKLLNSPTLKCVSTGATPGQKIRLITPNILQKATPVRAQVAKTSTKSIVLPSNITGANVVVVQPQKSIVISGAATDVSAQPAVASENSAELGLHADDADKNYQVANTADSNAQLIAIDVNQTNNVFANQSNLVSETNTLPKEDILAKALENTDVLQTEITFTDVSQSVLDTISVAQNTPLTYKTDAVYDTNLTLNTPPIMSSFETPSRALNSAAAAETVSSEMIIIDENSDNNEFVT